MEISGNQSLASYPPTQVCLGTANPGMRSPTDASPTPSRVPTHGSGPMRIASPSSWWTFTSYSLPVLISAPEVKKYATAKHQDGFLNNPKTYEVCRRNLPPIRQLRGPLSANTNLQRGAASSHSRGRVNWNMAPRGSFGATRSRPPCASMMERQMVRPIPMPLGLVV
jgi:hypothetical protein